MHKLLKLLLYTHHTHSQPCLLTFTCEILIYSPLLIFTVRLRPNVSIEIFLTKPKPI